MRYAHTNIVADNWQVLARFYIEVFGCTIKPPPRKQSGQWLARGTGVEGAALEGVHLLLPGYGDDGPTLEVFTYSVTLGHEIGAPNRRGLGHVAFEVEDVSATAGALLEQGGSLIGEITERRIEGVGVITFVYARDPEGNIIEIQSWRKGRRGS